mmetsp:Transcript_44144/g.88534  ORF Transcript_44144/g.88534 Transcript_44144/m.88534 type:complete len:430 (-) Transcript_44144:187-1476(-)
MAAHRSPLLAAAVLATAALAVTGWSYLNQRESAVGLAQEGVFTPGLEINMVPRRAPTQRLFQSKAQVAMGQNGGQNGLWPMPDQPPPTWTRGGNTYVYDGIYGIGQRPTTGVWASGSLPQNGEEEEEEQAAPTARAGAGAGAPPLPPTPPGPPRPPSAPVASEPAEEDDEEAGPGMAQAGGPTPPQEEEQEEEPGEEEEEEPEEEEEEPQEEEEEEPEEEEEEAPEEEEEECGEEPCQQGHVMVNVPAAAPTAPLVQQVPVPYPAAASQQLPMEWAAEDAAEHAYNLAQWRVKILKAKMDQAKLRKQLMHLSMGEDAGGSAEEEAKPQRASGAELRAIKGSLLTLAQETTAAIKQLKDQMQALRSAACCSEKGPTTQLSQVNGSPMEQQLALIKAQKAKEVKNLKERMDKQLDGLLKKVTTLIQNKRRS